MRFSTIQTSWLAIASLVGAQSCPGTTVTFEDLKNVPALGLPNPQVITNGYSGLNWVNFYGVTPSPAAQFLLPQGKMFVKILQISRVENTLIGRPTNTPPFTNRSFAVAPNSPATNPPIISAAPGGSFAPRSIFIGTFTEGVAGAASFATASTITVTATFTNGTTADVVFNFDPPTTLLGLTLNAEALQYFDFPCAWAGVVSLGFRPQAESGVNNLLGLAIDNFRRN